MRNLSKFFLEQIEENIERYNMYLVDEYTGYYIDSLTFLLQYDADYAREEHYKNLLTQIGHDYNVAMHFVDMKNMDILFFGHSDDIQLFKNELNRRGLFNYEFKD